MRGYFHSYVRMILEGSPQVKQVVLRRTAPFGKGRIRRALSTRLQDQAAIHRDLCASDIARHVRGQEHGEFGDVV